MLYLFKVSASITESETKYLKEIFQSYQGLDKVHSDEVSTFLLRSQTHNISRFHCVLFMVTCCIWPVITEI